MPSRDSRAGTRVFERSVLQPFRSHAEALTGPQQRRAIGRHQVGPLFPAQRERVEPEAAAQRVGNPFTPERRPPPRHHPQSIRPASEAEPTGAANPTNR